MQSQVDRDQFKAGVISAQADVYSADLALAQQLGQAEKLSAQMPVPSGSLEVSVRTFDPDQLVSNALQKRSDVISRQRAVHSRRAAYRVGASKSWSPTSGSADRILIRERARQDLYSRQTILSALRSPSIFRFRAGGIRENSKPLAPRGPRLNFNCARRRSGRIRGAGRLLPLSSQR